MRRAQRPVVFFFAGSLVIGIIFTGDELWRLATTQRVFEYIEASNGDVAGWHTESRRDRNSAGPFRVWWVDTGLLRSSGWEEPGIERFTTWGLDGSIEYQPWLGKSSKAEKEKPPWWWDVEPQTEPTAPWWGSGMTAEEWVREHGGERY